MAHGGDTPEKPNTRKIGHAGDLRISLEGKEVRRIACSPRSCRGGRRGRGRLDGAGIDEERRSVPRGKKMRRWRRYAPPLDASFGEVVDQVDALPFPIYRSLGEGVEHGNGDDGARHGGGNG